MTSTTQPSTHSIHSDATEQSNNLGKNKIDCKEEEANDLQQRPRKEQLMNLIVQRIVSFLRNRLTWSPETRQRVCTGIALAILSWVGYRYRALLTTNRRRRNNNSKLDYQKLASEAPLSTLLNALSNGSVKQALVGSKVVYYFLTSPESVKGEEITVRNNNKINSKRGYWKQSTLPPESSKIYLHILERLTSSSPLASVDVSMLRERPTWAELLSTPFYVSLPFIYLALLYRMLQNLHRQNNGMDMDDANKRTSSSGSGASSFDQVGGLDRILQELQQVVEYVQHPSKYQSLDASPPRGILLYGPPGSGKTLLARALAGEVGHPNQHNNTHSSNTIDSFTVCSASEFVEMYVGRGAARVRSLFASARQQAWRNYQAKLHPGSSWWPSFLSTGSSTREINKDLATRKPTALIFIDELDAVAKKRLGSLGSSNDEREQTLNQLLTEMDGFSTQDDVLVIVVAATNRADVLDPAVLRRLEWQLHVGPPDLEGRVEILQIHGRRLEQADGQTIDWKYLAGLCPGFTGAELKTVVNDAALLALRGSSVSDTAISNSNKQNKPCLVTTQHIEQAIGRFQASKKRVHKHGQDNNKVLLQTYMAAMATPQRNNTSNGDSDDML